MVGHSLALTGTEQAVGSWAWYVARAAQSPMGLGRLVATRQVRGLTGKPKQGCTRKAQTTSLAAASPWQASGVRARALVRLQGEGGELQVEAVRSFYLFMVFYEQPQLHL